MACLALRFYKFFYKVYKGGFIRALWKTRNPRKPRKSQKPRKSTKPVKPRKPKKP